jgi:hypothetical protein
MSDRNYYKQFNTVSQYRKKDLYDSGIEKIDGSMAFQD